MQRITVDLTAVWERVQGGETVSEAVVAIEETEFVRMSSILCAWFARQIHAVDKRIHIQWKAMNNR